MEAGRLRRLFRAHPSVSGAAVARRVSDAGHLVLRLRQRAISMTRFDVVIVGAGPAGAWAATRVAERGARVAILDPSHPREKPCGGGLTGRALALVSGAIDASRLASVQITGARFRHGERTAFVDLAAAPGALPLVVIGQTEFRWRAPGGGGAGRRGARGRARDVAATVREHVDDRHPRYNLRGGVGDRGRRRQQPRTPSSYRGRSPAKICRSRPASSCTGRRRPRSTSRSRMPRPAISGRFLVPITWRWVSAPRRTRARRPSCSRSPDAGSIATRLPRRVPRSSVTAGPSLRSDRKRWPPTGRAARAGCWSATRPGSSTRSPARGSSSPCSRRAWRRTPWPAAATRRRRTARASVTRSTPSCCARRGSRNASSSRGSSTCCSRASNAAAASAL